jgi:hypothetical protein
MKTSTTGPFLNKEDKLMAFPSTAVALNSGAWSAIFRKDDIAIASVTICNYLDCL